MNEERTPSCEVFLSKKGEWKFKDFSSGHGGDTIKLCQLLESCNFREAVLRLTDKSFSFSQLNIEAELKICNGIELRKVKDLENKALIEYLRSRHISFELGKRYLKEVYYTTQSGSNIFSLAFRNHKGGYATRNKMDNSKICIGANAPTFIKGSGPGNTLNIFEGFFDFLSYLEHNSLQAPKLNTVVLNSLASMDKYLNGILKYPQIHAYLDRDKAGFRALSKLNQLHKNVIDCSFYYDGFKDFNDFLVSL